MQVRAADPADLDAMLALMPALASFPLPAHRNPLHLWEGDADMLRDWAAGNHPDCLVNTAKDDDGTLLGMTMVSLREELLSHAPSAHLEAIVVTAAAQGKGVGRALMEAAEAGARARGAKAMSLHVFATNDKARKLYATSGYDEELLRCIKLFDDQALK